MKIRLLHVCFSKNPVHTITGKTKHKTPPRPLHIVAVGRNDVIYREREDKGKYHIFPCEIITETLKIPTSGRRGRVAETPPDTSKPETGRLVREGHQKIRNFERPSTRDQRRRAAAILRIFTTAYESRNVAKRAIGKTRKFPRAARASPTQKSLGVVHLRAGNLKKILL